MKNDHPDIRFGKTGVLIINLGTPDSTSWWDIRKYLKEFLSDRRVIEVNPLVWKIILNLFILTFRPSKTAHAYKKIWRKATNESPLLYYTRSQAKKLKSKIGNEKIIVDFAMRYGNPSIKSKLNLLKDLQEQLNLTILFISHDLPVVRQMCDRIGVLKDGKLCEVSNTEDLFLKPTHEYTKELLRLMPKIESIYN